jgi:hypothetical protein
MGAAAKALDKPEAAVNLARMIMNVAGARRAVHD